MEFKKFEKGTEKHFILNDFSRGINYQKGKNGNIKDCENFIYENGRLVTRRGLRPKTDTVLNGNTTSYSELKNVTVFHKNKKMHLVVLNETDEMDYIGYYFYLLGPDGEVVPASVIEFTRNSSSEFNRPQTLYAFSGKPITGSGIFAIASVYMELTDSIDIRYYELNSDFTWWQRIWDTDMYIPTFYIDGRGQKYKQSAITLPEPQFLESRNLLSPYVNCFFTSDGTSTAFYLPIKDALKQSGDYIDCEITLANGAVLKFRVPYGKNFSNTVAYNEQDVSINFENTLGGVYFRNLLPPESSARPNNIKVTVYCKSSVKSEIIGSMSKCIWYSSGDSGSRLCVAGSSDYPSLVCVSEADNAFYFPEENLISVGDPNQKVTALAVQNKSLVIFKQRELYCGGFTAGKLKFTHLHSGIGCDLPNTIKLCENRLVWANQDKKIYTLNSVNDYGAVAVYLMSKKAEQQLSEENFNDETSAAYLNNKYYLFFGNRIYVCDLASSVLQNSREFINSAAFYRLVLPACVKVALGFGESQINLLCQVVNYGSTYSVCDFSGAAGNDIVKINRNQTVSYPYKSVLEFSNLDNDEPHIRKQFSRAYINCYSEKGAEVEFSDIYGDTVKKSSINMKYTQIKNAVPYRLEPFINSESMGIKLITEGDSFIHSVTVYYKELI